MAEQWRILVIEGEENLNWNVVNSLQKDGYIVRGVTSGGEAIRLLWGEEYDVVICSQPMADTDGFELLQWMRAYCPNTQMVMLAAPGNSTVRAQALEQGVAGYLEKPLDLHALKEELRRLLHSTGFSASLDSFDLLDVIQIITMSRKSIALVVSTGLEEQGILRFQNGELIWAEYGILRGEEAFFALAAHKNGTVIHRPWNDQITPNVTQPLSRLIFQALQYRSKYAEAQQMSSELEAIRPSSALPSLPSTTLPAVLQDFDDDDDRPFQFMPTELPIEKSPASMMLDQAMRNGSSMGGGIGGVRNTEWGSSSAKEWWEPTGAFPRLQPSESIRAITDENTTPSTTHKAVTAQNSPLPSWLTDQPTNQTLPVLRGNTGQMPAAPRTWAPATPAVPPNPPAPPSTVPQALPFNPSESVMPQMLPNVPQSAGSVWPALPFNPSESGLRKNKPEEALYTGRQPAIRTGSNPTRPAGAEWQGPEQAFQQGLSGSMRAVKPDTLHSLAALKKPGVTPATPVNVYGAGTSGGALPTRAGGEVEERDLTRPMQKITKEMSQAHVAITPGQAAKRNYPALAAALQTLGYSVPGFIASAVVGLDGLPIAQVAVDELDISPLCAHLSQVLRGALQALELGGGEPYEHTVISSRTQHILLRMIGNKKEAFQVLITTRETNPAESLEVMANIEAAIATALR